MSRYRQSFSEHRKIAQCPFFTRSLVIIYLFVSPSFSFTVKPMHEFSVRYIRDVKKKNKYLICVFDEKFCQKARFAGQ